MSMSRIDFDGEKIFHRIPEARKFSTSTKLLIKISGGRIKNQNQASKVWFIFAIIMFLITFWMITTNFNEQEPVLTETETLIPYDQI